MTSGALILLNVRKEMHFICEPNGNSIFSDLNISPFQEKPSYNAGMYILVERMLRGT
jgi:hypothetical protein